jgi:CDP-diacylglycerol--glycerol-3-phosphate 3-phosphatidyltransferase
MLYYTTSDAEADLGDPRMYLYLSLACLVLGNLTSYARARAESLGMHAKGGIAERSDRLVSILVMTGFAGLLDLPILRELTLWVLAAASLVTVFQRMVIVYRQTVPAPGTDA